MSLYPLFYRQEEIASALCEKPDRAVFVVPDQVSADLLAGLKFLATTTVTGAFTDEHANRFEACNVVVVGDCGGMHRALEGKAKTNVWLDVPDVPKWFKGIQGDKVKAVRQLVDAARKRQIANGAPPANPVHEQTHKVSLSLLNVQYALMTGQDPRTQIVHLLGEVSQLVRLTDPPESEEPKR